MKDLLHKSYRVINLSLQVALFHFIINLSAIAPGCKLSGDVIISAHMDLVPFSKLRDILRAQNLSNSVG